MATRLEAQELIERRPGHGQRIEHYLTVAGTHTLAAGHLIANDIFRASFANLAEEERATLLDLLLRMIGESAT